MPNAPLPVFQQCLNEALELTRQWAPEWLNRLQALLREREAMAPNYTERTALIDAYSALQRQHEVVARHWLSALAEEMEEAPTDLMGLPRRTSLRLDELELMGDDQVQEKVEVARVQQAVTMAAEDHFHEFTARLSTAQGFRAVNAEANPLRVQVYVDTLLSALKAVNVPAPVRARWLQVGGASLGKALSDMYLRLDHMLAGQGVKPAGYNVVTAPDSRAVVEEELAGTDLDGPMTEREALLTLDHLHQLLVGSDDANGHAVSDEMTRSLAAEVVSLMMQRIAGDKRLLKPVRSQLQDMKPALLELARDNPRFFADRDNPARRLLDNVTAHALAFTSEQEAGFSTFLSELRRTVNELRRPDARLEERFPTELDRLRRSQDASVPRGEVEARGRAMQTLVRVEQRKLLAEKVAEEFRARPDYPKAPGPAIPDGCVGAGGDQGPHRRERAPVPAVGRFGREALRGHPHRPAVVVPARPGQPEPASAGEGDSARAAYPARGTGLDRLPAREGGRLLPDLDGPARSGLQDPAQRAFRGRRGWGRARRQRAQPRGR